jgi:23S rRNA pseudouridine1911/1915/1917 synthase
MTKTYRALVGPTHLSDTFVLTHPIGRVPYPALGTVYAATPTGKSARSEGRVICRTTTQTLLEVTIHTGRPHQIRIHLAAAGYPLLGDPLYAPGGLPFPATDRQIKMPVPGDCGYWLHAYRLRFIHPRTRSPLEILCPPPPRLQSCDVEPSQPVPQRGQTESVTH